MSKRPAPRTSSLANTSPITTAPVPVTQDGPAVEPVPAQQAPKARRPKVSFYQDPANTRRVRAALVHTLTTEGNRTLSDFIDQAVMAEVERLEGKYNNGEPFPDVAALTRGRPIGT